jgi:hypothetical protein
VGTDIADSLADSLARLTGDERKIVKGPQTRSLPRGVTYGLAWFGDWVEVPHRSRTARRLPQVIEARA